ncbi:MAG: radical SAM protein [Desulfobacterales bacterium]|nr:radical SAM protein [Desulfobacteraceae bacterium]MBT4364325.1 radical SAM protein [Desulfobacteraceae bacterium]MBT7698087.1 radical SAM protein [Desulfobacterales bacterium]
MHYEGNIIRPPSEAYSILLQASVGCSHHKCTFCGAYDRRRFKIKKDNIIMADIAYAAKHYRGQTRLFICDGDALIIPHKRLLNILKEIKKQLPWVKRVGVYANTKSINMKTSEQLEELREHGLKIAYMGLETGDDVTLKMVNKGTDSTGMVSMGKKIRNAGIKLSITVLLGLAGRKRSAIHAIETGRVLSAIDPEYVGALSLMLVPGTPLYEEYKAGRFTLIEPDEMLEELGIMIANTNLTRGLFHSNHASNYLPIKAKFPKDKDSTLELIRKAVAGKVRLRPEHLRAL